MSGSVDDLDNIEAITTYAIDIMYHARVLCSQPIARPRHCGRGPPERTYGGREFACMRNEAVVA